MRQPLNPRLARFLSPDPLGGDVSNPQSLNRYAYVQNDPVNKVDPSGLCGTGFDGGDDGACGGCWWDGCFDPNLCDYIWCGPSWGGGGGGGGYFPPPPPPPGEPLGDPSGVAGQYGIWNESIPGGPPFGGIFFPSSPTGCTYGGGNCGGIVFGFTGQVGVSGNVVGWGWYLNVALGIVWDGHGHLAFFGSGGLGKSVGASAGVGGQAGFSSADTVCGIGGPFGNASASAGNGGGGTIDVFGGKGDGWDVGVPGASASSTTGSCVSLN